MAVEITSSDIFTPGQLLQCTPKFSQVPALEKHTSWLRT